MSEMPLRRKCKFVYCRKPFEAIDLRIKFCCPECRILQRRYMDRKRKAKELTGGMW